MSRIHYHFLNALNPRNLRFTLLACIVMAASSCAVGQHADANDMQCPGSPKCVSSEETGSSQFIEPFVFDDQPDQAMARLKSAVLSEEGVTITKEQGNTLYAEARSDLFGFVDDMKFVLMPAAGKIQVRSSARTGYSDLGVNRRRVERIRTVFMERKP